MRTGLGIVAGALVLLALVGTLVIAWQSPAVHASLMQRLADSGLAVDQDVQFEPGWFKAHSHGRIQLHDSLCGSCEPLQYQGTLRHGLGAWLGGDFTLASARYSVQLPAAGLNPALPPVLLHAGLGWSGQLAARVAMRESSHQGAHFEWDQQGISGHLLPGQLSLHSPGLTLTRGENGWLSLQQTQLDAAADGIVQARLSSEAIEIPVWRWSGETLSVRYSQRELAEQLSFDARLDIPRGRFSGVADHGAVTADLQLDRLALEATQAFIRELPPLLAEGTSPAMRMLGLMSLYSLHGPAFFAAAPALNLDIPALPLPDGEASVALDLRVRKGVRRPPMHPLEWQRALEGQLDVVAPPQALAAWWQSVAGVISLTTGLPRDYPRLISGGWVQQQADGRHRLFIRLDPLKGPQPAAPASPLAALR